MLSIVDIKGKIAPVLVAMTLINIYSYWMIAKYLNLVDDESKEIMAKIKNSPQILEALKDVDFWKFIAVNVKGCQMWEDNLIFYQDRFNDWLKEYVAEEL